LFAEYYNYLFYLTVKRLNALSNSLIIQPMISLFKLLSISKERIRTNVSYAFRLMIWTLTCFILSIELLVFRTLNHLELENYIFIIFTSSAMISIVINYFTLWKSKKYQSYFLKFKNQKKSSKGFFAILYHLAISMSCIMLFMNI
jgi:hypothetical protein